MVELYRRPLLAWYWQALAAIPVDRAKISRAVAATVLQRLRAGRVVGIFPEGGIRVDIESVLEGGRINAGACRLAMSANVPLVPVVILGSETMMRVGGWLWPHRAFRVEVIFGEPLLPPPGIITNTKGAADELSVRLSSLLRELAATQRSGIEVQPI